MATTNEQGDELGREVSPSSILPRSAFVNAYPKFYNITKMELTHREEDMYLYFKPCTSSPSSFSVADAQPDHSPDHKHAPPG